jgi:hypothetical protein
MTKKIWNHVRTRIRSLISSDSSTRPPSIHYLDVYQLLCNFHVLPGSYISGYKADGIDISAARLQR